MNDDLLKIIGIVAIISYLLFLAIKSMSLHMNVMEGLTNNDNSTKITGEGNNMDNFLSTIKNQVKSMKDTLAIDQNKQKYENIVVSIDDYVNLLMVKKMLNIDPRTTDSNLYTNDFKTLNELNSVKKSLDTIMKYIDS